MSANVSPPAPRVDRTPLPRWVTVADALAVALVMAAGVVKLTGGARVHLAGLTISVTSAPRLLLFAVIVAGLRHITFPRQHLAGRLSDIWSRFQAKRAVSPRSGWVACVAGLVGLLLCLAVASRPTRIGDGAEYMAMARNFAWLRPPAVSQQELIALQRPFWRGNPSYVDVMAHTIAASDGRRDFYHFWVYPLLASPFVRLAWFLGLHPNHGFLAVNMLCLVAAVVVLLPRLGAAATLVLATGPIAWWIDKAHTEVFTFAALAIAVTMLQAAPGFSLLLLGAATAQNPALGPVAAILFFRTLGRGRLRRRSLWVGAAAGAALAAINPLYYSLRIGTPFPLAQTTIAHVPGVAELGTFVWDPNLGLLPNHPAFAGTLAAAIATLLVRARKSLLAVDLWLMAVLAAVLLVAFAQTTNLNHGGTPGISRYALWLIPLAVPLLARLSQVTEGRRCVWLPAMAAISILWSCVVYPPSRSEDSYMAPTRIAAWIWTTQPALNNPLPEIFCERVLGSGHDLDEHVIPAATDHCEKILFAGAGTRPVAWPPRCPRPAIPNECRAEQVLCYANRHAGGYGFVVAPRQPAFRWTAVQVPAAPARRDKSGLR